jgi:hypothetical protein
LTNSLNDAVEGSRGSIRAHRHRCSSKLHLRGTTRAERRRSREEHRPEYEPPEISGAHVSIDFLGYVDESFRIKRRMSSAMNVRIERDVAICTFC